MSQRAVFVIGCPRSGTSLVGGLIGRHPMVFNAEESLFLYLMSNWSAMLRPPVAPLTERFITAASALMKETMLTATTEAGRSIYARRSRPWRGGGAPRG
jgi:Sulfotransferase family